MSTNVSVDPTVSIEITERVKTQISEGKCLACNTCTETARRGLCVKCYTNWSRVRARMDVVKASQYDARLIQSGFLLAIQQIRKLKQSSIFERMAT